MNFQLGIFRELELVVDVRPTGVVVTLADGYDNEAVLRMMANPRRTYPPVYVGDMHRVYVLSPLVPSRAINTKQGVIHVWEWISHYYWTTQKDVILRRADFTVARLSRHNYRVEMCTWDRQLIQYIPDKHTEEELEESFLTTRLED